MKIVVTRTRHDDVLRRRPVRSDHPGVRGALPDAVHSRSARCRPTSQAHLRVPEDLFDVQTRMYAPLSRDRPVGFYNNDRPVDGPDRSRRRPRACRPRPTTSRCACPTWRSPEFLLLQPMVPASRPNMIAWIAARNDAPNYGQVPGLPVPAGHVGPRPEPDRGPDRRGSHDQRPDHPVEPGGSKVVSGNLIVVPVQNSPDLPRADLPAVGEQCLPGVPADRRRHHDRCRLGQHPLRRPDQLLAELAQLVAPAGREPVARTEPPPSSGPNHAGHRRRPPRGARATPPAR